MRKAKMPEQYWHLRGKQMKKITKTNQKGNCPK
jgi:hypothetical protein